SMCCTIAAMAQFGSQQIISSHAESPIRVIPYDVNVDGFLDVIYTNRGNISRIVWKENLDGQGNFGNEQFLSDNIPAIEDIQLYDFDNDSDKDILYKTTPGLLAWIENIDGQGNFGEQKLISNEVYRATDAAAGDINNNGFLDVISASSYDDKIAWYENRVLGIYENEAANYQIYPNPTSGKLNIESKLPISQISIFNLLGQRIESKQHTNKIDLSKAEAGVYLLKIEDGNGSFETHKILKQ